MTSLIKIKKHTGKGACPSRLKNSVPDFSPVRAPETIIMRLQSSLLSRLCINDIIITYYSEMPNSVSMSTGIVTFLLIQ